MFRFVYLFAATALLSCGNRSAQESETTNTMVETSMVSSVPAQVPTFDADSAYSFVEEQVNFGPRVPNTQAHKACGNYLSCQLERLGAKVYQQNMTVSAYDKTPLEALNIIGSFNPDNQKRILLFAHWDSRPYADHDPNRTMEQVVLEFCWKLLAS